MKSSILKNKMRIVLASAVLFSASAVVAMSVRGEAGDRSVTAKAGKQVSYKWFQINGNIDAADPVPAENAVYLGEGETAPSGSGCGGANYQCVSGFDASQVTGANELDGTQMPQSVSSRKN